MNIIVHNLKVAFRNLMKYKLQTLISIVSIAIGIVTLALAHSILDYYRLPAIYHQPYHDRAYKVGLSTINDNERCAVSEEILHALKGNGGLRNAERITVYNGHDKGLIAEFHLQDSTVRKGQIAANLIDPEYPNYSGMQSAITGKEIKVLKPGEAIIEENYAKTIFGNSDPIGAVQTNTGKFQTIPITIVDIYKTLSFQDDKRANGSIYFCLTDRIEDHMPDRDFYAAAIDVVLKEGCTEQQLLKEIDLRLKPFGVQANISKVLDDKDIQINITIRTLVYIFSSLILLAAMIGFLRMQMQLFRMRRREMALRIVNGANSMKLFGLLFTEVALSIGMAIIVAIVLAILLQNFLDTGLKTVIDIPVHNIWSFCLIVGGGLLFLCCIIVWLTIMHSIRAGKGLAENMRRSRNHLFRNVMLGLQIAISIVFVCGTFILANGVDNVLKAFNVPANDDFYKKCLYLRPYRAEQPELLIDEIERLPDLDKMVMYRNMWFPIREVEECPEYLEKYDNNRYLDIYQTNDSATPSILGMDVVWFNRNIDRNRCLLLSEEIYKRFKEFGFLEKNTLTIGMGKEENMTLPIAGIIKKLPYVTHQDALIAITPDGEKAEMEFLLIPKSGKYKALARSADEIIKRLEPTIINKMVFNYRTMIGAIPEMADAIRAGGWILGCVSLLICVMSIFSTITLDTRARRKEVAVRKVNGAKSKNIYKMFGRVYIVLIAASLIIAVPISVMFNNIIETMVTELDPSSSMSPVGPIILGSIIVIMLIFLIVGWQIYRVMKVDPAKIIAKE